MTNVVIQQNSRKLLMMDILMSETRWAHKWNKIASDIKLVFYSSTSLFIFIKESDLHINPPGGEVGTKADYSIHNIKAQCKRKREAIVWCWSFICPSKILSSLYSVLISMNLPQTLQWFSTLQGIFLAVSLLNININITVFCSHGGESEHTSGSLYSFNECTGWLKDTVPIQYL